MIPGAAAIETLERLLKILSLQQLLTALAVLLVTWLVIKLLRLAFEHLARRFNRYRMQITGMLPMVSLILWSLAIGLMVMNVLNLPENALVGLIASATVAAGLGAQDVIKNTVAGIFLLINRPFQVGDMVQMGEHYGEVIGINVHATRLHTFDDSVITVPNSKFVTNAVVDSNNGALSELVVIPFDLPATVDISTVSRLAWEAAICSPYAQLQKPVLILAEDRFDRMSLTHFKVKVYVVDVRLERLLASDIITRIKRTLLAQGIIDERLVFGPYAGIWDGSAAVEQRS